jgi:RNA polymerase sigma-B factor
MSVVTRERMYRGVQVQEPVKGRPPEGESAQELRARETRDLFERFERGDPGARDELIERFLPLARQLARRYQRANEPFDDLLQVASVGLVKAVDRFDPARGVAFSSYAVPTILGELKRYFRDSGWAVHVPRGVQERVLKVDRVVAKLSGRLGRSPAMAEIAEEMDCSVEDVLEAMDAAQAYDAISLDAKRGGDDDEGETHGESLGVEEERYELIEYGATIDRTMKALPDRDRLVLRYRFVDDMTQSEIAEIIGVSQMQVSRIIRRALARLQTVAEAGEDS